MGFDITRLVKMTPAYKLIASVGDVVNPPKPARPPSGGLEAGDILIKLNDVTFLNALITFGQSYTDNGDHSLWTHAGLGTSGNMIAEMDGNGLQHNNLAGSNARYTYAVFRCSYRQVAIAAAEANAVLLSQAKGKITYSKMGAFSSLLPSLIDSRKRGRLGKALDEIAAGKPLDLFCSEHVVFCYLAALEEENTLQMVNKGVEFQHLRISDFFSKEPLHYSPGYLYSMLLDNKLFSYLGCWNRMKWG